MATKSARRVHRSRRRVAALNFLSNISLDGSHRDTKYSIFNREYILRLRSSKSTEKCKQATNWQNDDDDDTSEDENKPPERASRLKTETTGHSRKLTICCSPLHPVAPSRRPMKPGEADAQELTTNSADLQNGEGGYGLISKPQEATRERKGSSTRSIKHVDSRRHTCSTDNRQDAGSGGMSVSFKTRYWRSVSETPHTHSSTEDDMPRLSYGVSLRKRLFRQASVSGSTSTINDDLPQLVHGSSRRRRYSSSSSWSSSSASPMKELRGRSRIKDDRVVYLRTQGAPFSIFSVLSYNKARERVIVRCGGAASVAAGEAAGGRRRHASTSRMDGSDILAMAGVEPTPDDDEASFAAYLVPRRRESHEGAPAGDTDPDAADPAGDYDPSRLDNPELIAGRHRTTLRFCSHLASVIDYVRPGELKAELNAKFAARHPRIDLTLSKLRSLKRDVRRTAADAGLDLYTVAAAYVYFERTVLLGCLNKANRKFVAGTALLLSAKLNDCKGEQLTALLGAIEDRMRVDKRELLAYEFPLLVALKFALHTPDAEVSPHYQRLLYET